ncbi:monofunctional biosynthetic peptidoglycan transglycosylase [Piscinibacter sp. Jin2]|uniref:Biosynthetic peptidoglycan transglycosylase n=2 Tax=Aquariibacter lacus TaxID=2801332 RepID=A0A9X0XCW9_9BURK|nr:monofunctional biosynthetic peptidoglycan transglycosylase [Piscinibacter lacus]MBL0719181.1 monofunctional biosynthetic peptidoglycan transglycosylase [Piscinibacter lacus]
MRTIRWRPPRALLRLAGLLLLAGLMLQLVFALRIAAMAWIDPASTAFQRSEAWRLLSTRGELPWRQSWRDADEISVHLKRAVIAAEDASFVQHDGIDWDAIEKAWERNQRAQARAEARRPSQATARPPKVVGGSTITQQLAKNLFLSGERTLPRKAQEAVLTLMLEALLDKRRILAIYLNHVEWGEGVFGAEAAAGHYFRSTADRLGPGQAARLAVMLPAPKRFEKRPSSPYVAGRAATVAARMGAVELP